MRIDISDIANTINKARKVECSLDFDTFTCRLGSFLVLHKPAFTLTISNDEDKAILVQGSGEVTLSIPCGRCLDEVPTSIHFDIDRRIDTTGDTMVDEEMEETDYLIGFLLDVDLLVYSEILVNWPMKVLCRDDCKGICSVCGKNLNHGTCNCDRSVLDPRMAAIQDIFKQFKEV